MAFNKEEYWKNKPNNIGSIRNKLKSKVVPPENAEISFGENGEFMVRNRAAKRKRRRNSLFTKKGFIERIWAIRIVRKQHGKKKVKYVFNLYK